MSTINVHIGLRINFELKYFLHTTDAEIQYIYEFSVLFILFKLEYIIFLNCNVRIAHENGIKRNADSESARV